MLNKNMSIELNKIMLNIYHCASGSGPFTSFALRSGENLQALRGYISLSGGQRDAELI